MSKELVLSVLNKLKDYIEAECKLGLDQSFRAALNFGIQSEKRFTTTCIQMLENTEAGKLSFLRSSASLYSPVVGHGVQVLIDLDINLKNSSYSSRKPVLVQISEAVELNNFDRLSLVTAKLSSLETKNKIKVEATNSRYNITYLSKKVSLFKDLKLTKEESERKILVAAVLHMSSSWLFEHWTESSYPDIVEATWLARELAEDYSFGDSNAKANRWYKKEGAKDLHVIRLAPLYPGYNQDFKTVSGKYTGSCPKLVETRSGFNVDMASVSRYIEVKTRNMLIADDDICSSCSKQLSCLAANYQEVPSQLDLLLPV